jgi:hypothetical protein
VRSHRIYQYIYRSIDLQAQPFPYLHPLDADFQGVDQFIDGLPTIIFRDFGQMSIAGCGGWAGMAKYGLDMAKA